jgi:hypothetical protein
MADDIIRAVFALGSADLGDGDEPEGWQTVLTAGPVRYRAALGGALPPITTKRLNGWVERFKEIGREVPIDLHHATVTAAAKNDPRFLDPALSAARGWISDLRVVGDDLQAFIKWTADGAALIREKKFRFPSIEFNRETVTGATLTNQPAADVPAFVLSRAATEYLDAEAGGATTEPAKYPSAESNPEAMEEPMTTETTGLAALLGVAEDEVEAKVKALHDDAETVTALAAELAEKEARMADLADADFDRELADRVFADGRMKNDDTAKAALRTVYDADRDGFIALCAAMVPGTVPVRKAEGADAEEPEDKDEPKALTAEAAGNELHALATTLTTDDTDYIAAYALACEQKPELLTAYEAGDGRDI